jgi:hypothetical protein
VTREPGAAHVISSGRLAAGSGPALPANFGNFGNFWGSRELAACLPNVMMGVNAALFREDIGSVAGRRLERIGLPRQYCAQPVLLDERDDRFGQGEEPLRMPGEGGSERSELAV